MVQIQQTPSTVQYQQVKAQAMADSYNLTRDMQASVRLNMQHYIWKESMGYLLHPSIKLPDSGVAIADVGTGTGIWAHDVARLLPNAEIHGLDISSEQFPAAGFLPSNMSLSYIDLFDEIPEEYVGKFDVVHVRLIFLPINQAGGDPGPVLRNLLKLTKEGGYIQWEEHDCNPVRRQFAKSSPQNPAESSEQLMKRLDYIFHSPTDWNSALALAKTFVAEGLENVENRELEVNDYIRVMEMVNELNVFWEMINRMPASAREGMDDLHEGTVKEWRKGVVRTSHKFLVVGRKPLGLGTTEVCTP